MDNYVLEGVIGRGSFGRVHRGRRRWTGLHVALKFIDKAGRSPADLATLRAEAAILRGLAHPNIVRWLDSFETATQLVIVTELAQGELYAVLLEDGPLSEPLVRSVARQLAEALAYLHARGIVYRDLKPQNVLVAPDGCVKLCDFGFAATLQSPPPPMMTTTTAAILERPQTTAGERAVGAVATAAAGARLSAKGTPVYLAPEVVDGAQPSAASDVWSLGVVLYELAAGRPPLYADDVVELLMLISEARDVAFPESVSAPLRGFLAALLERDPGRRASASEALRHPYLRAACHEGGSGRP